MQLARFHDGGFVLHKMTPCTTKNHCSGWFDKDGKLLDAEIRFRNSTRPVKRYGPTWRELQRIGGAYSQTQPNQKEQ